MDWGRGYVVAGDLGWTLGVGWDEVIDCRSGCRCTGD